MTEYRTILTTDDLDNLVKSIPSYPFRFFPTNKILYAIRKGDTIILKGIFITTRARIRNTDSKKTTIEIKARLTLQFYFIALFLLVFLCMFLFADNVTINGNTDPIFIERLSVVLIGLIVFIAVPAGILMKLKSDFVKRVERELKLTKTTANNT